MTQPTDLKKFTVEAESDKLDKFIKKLKIDNVGVLKALIANYADARVRHSNEKPILIDLATYVDGKGLILKSIELMPPYDDRYVLFIDRELKKIVRDEAKKRAKMLVAKYDFVESIMKEE